MDHLAWVYLMSIWYNLYGKVRVLSDPELLENLLSEGY